MTTVSVLIKPASGQCNLRCRYCFYRDETEKRAAASFGVMSEETLRAVLQKLLAAAEDSCAIVFQGGEPTLAGLDFFRRAVCLAEALNVNGCELRFALQSNGLLLDEAWCAFLAERKFLVGLSLDGPRALHDRNRVDTKGQGSYARARRALGLLKKHGVDVNILSVITAQTCGEVRRTNAFFSEAGLRWRQGIPCLDPLGETRGQKPWALTPEAYERYLKTAFDCWYEDETRGRPTYHRSFENLLMLLAGQAPEACGMLGVCGPQYVVEADGGVYPCDFYVLDAYRLGSLVTDSLARIDARRAALGFIEESPCRDPECRACRWHPLCRGGCRRDRDYFEAGLGRNYYCRAYRGFFEYAYERLEEIYRRRLAHA
ncbi:MAG: SPASM domain-containing protein [Oscillospiraceae bacterium]|nr:SPASM domain-containing protein [Oscillospiraceae bacterium]